MSHNRVGMALVVASIVMTALAGCAASAVPATAGGTLESVKPPVQLLRNEVANRVPTDLIDRVAAPSDAVVGCKADDSKYLTWKASVRVFLKPADDTDAESTQSDIVSSLQKQGWTQSLSDSAHAIRLKKTSSIASIVIDRVDGGAADDGGQINIEVTGPCLKTDGLRSDEVQKLINGG